MRPLFTEFQFSLGFYNAVHNRFRNSNVTISTNYRVFTEPGRYRSTGLYNLPRGIYPPSTAILPAHDAEPDKLPVTIKDPHDETWNPLKYIAFYREVSRKGNVACFRAYVPITSKRPIIPGIWLSTYGTPDDAIMYLPSLEGEEFGPHLRNGF